MDVNLRKTATDTAYVVVGVGVLGFQQAQVKRRDAVAKVERHPPRRPRHADRPGRLDQGPDHGLRRQTSATSSAHRRPRTVGATSAPPSARHASARPSARAVDAVGTQVKAGADVARTADPRVLGRAGRRRPPGPGRARRRAAAHDHAARHRRRASPTRSRRRSRSARPGCRAVGGTTPTARPEGRERQRLSRNRRSRARCPPAASRA